MPHIAKPIETIEEYQDVEKRVTKLRGSEPGSPEKDELDALIAALEKWNHDHGGERSDPE